MNLELAFAKSFREKGVWQPACWPIFQPLADGADDHDVAPGSIAATWHPCPPKQMPLPPPSRDQLVRARSRLADQLRCGPSSDITAELIFCPFSGTGSYSDRLAAAHEAIREHLSANIRAEAQPHAR